jgi:hypothetical protein
MAIQDLIVPVWASMEAGVYYDHRPMHRHHHIDDKEDAKNQTGLGGLMRIAEDVNEQHQVKEQICYQLTANALMIAEKLQDTVNGDGKVERLIHELHGQIMNQSFLWVSTRNWMTLNRVAPKPFNVGEMQ